MRPPFESPPARGLRAQRPQQWSRARANLTTPARAGLCRGLIVTLLAAICAPAAAGQVLESSLPSAPPPVGPKPAAVHPQRLPPAHGHSSLSPTHPPRRARLRADPGGTFPLTSRAVDIDFDACAPGSSDVRSGPALVDYLVSVPDAFCVDPLFNGSLELRLLAFRGEHVVYVAQSAAQLSMTYDGTNSSGIATLFYFMQAAYYNEFYVDDVVFTANVDQAMVFALDQFIASPHYTDITDEHGYVLGTVFVVLDSLGGSPRSVDLDYRTRYLPVVRH